MNDFRTLQDLMLLYNEGAIDFDLPSETTQDGTGSLTNRGTSFKPKMLSFS